jgi:hypothetical protein
MIARETLIYRGNSRSSVVEHPLGKVEVVCSIHTGSTTPSPPCVATDPNAAIPRVTAVTLAITPRGSLNH